MNPSQWRSRGGAPAAAVPVTGARAAAVLIGLLAALTAAAGPRPAAAQPAAVPGLNVSSISTPLPAAPAPPALLGGASPYQGSVPAGEATAETLQLSLAAALQLGMERNLGLIDRGLDSRVAQADREKSLSSLLPQLSGAVRQWSGELSLVTFGFKFPGIPEIIGPFSYQDARVTLTQQLFNLQSLRDFQANREAARAADLTLADARDLVVVAVGAAYYQVVASAARVETAQAQLNASKSLEELAINQVSSGLSPAIDRFRSTVQRQSDEQRLAVYGAQLEKDKLTLGRLIGLPAGQRFALTTPVPFVPWNGPRQDEALRLAYQGRRDLRSAEAALRSAELARQAAAAERLPSLAVEGDYGRVGHNLSNTDGTYTLTAGLSVPIFEGGRIHSEVVRADAKLERRRAELASLRGQVDYEVRSGFLDLQAAQTSVEVAQKNVDLAAQTLAQAKDRFANGVTNNLEVVLAEQEVAAANENYIASLFSHNYTKLALLRAMGQVEEGIKQFLNEQPSGRTQ
jgi:outer membrane protein TolC